MNYALWNTGAVLFVVVVSLLLSPAWNWQTEWRPNYSVREPEYLTMVDSHFTAPAGQNDSFKLLRVEGNKVFIGTRNRLYYLRFMPSLHTRILEWEVDAHSRLACLNRGEKECDNYIRVMLLKDYVQQYYICGTYAYQPRCRYYTIDENDQFQLVKDFEIGTGFTPLNPNFNSTAIFVDGKIFAATVSDADERDPLILQKVNDSYLIRTQTRDSLVLNEPNFVSSYDKNDKVFFIFRETAVENINCGKAVFSRVARVCKNDKGSIRHEHTFTSFFKARLNCSIPGDYPFHFDEIQSTTELGRGNYKPSWDPDDAQDMIYGVFNTPENGIKGSAVCAFTHAKIEEAFRGRFKGQESYLHNWLPIPWDEAPNPQTPMCSTNSKNLSYWTLNFIRKHPLMDESIQSAGGMPILVFTSFKSKFTQITVDWQVPAADGIRYDVMFVGTDDGRVIKAINKGFGKVESVVVEDIQVLQKGDPVVGLKLIRHHLVNDSRLVVVSKRQVVSIPLQRCDRASTCKECVALQDPYCVWNVERHCISSRYGLQEVATGNFTCCDDDDFAEVVETRSVTPAPECSCPSGSIVGSHIDGDEEKVYVIKTPSVEASKEKPEEKDKGQLLGASTTPQTAGMALEIVIVAVVVSVISSLILGFFIGFMFQKCKYARSRGNTSYDRNYSSLQRGRNRLSSGDNPYFHTDHSNLTPKQLNYLVGTNTGKTNANMETKPMTKSNKVYV